MYQKHCGKMLKGHKSNRLGRLGKRLQAVRLSLKITGRHFPALQKMLYSGCFKLLICFVKPYQESIGQAVRQSLLPSKNGRAR